MVPLKFRGVSDHVCFLSMNPKDLDYLRKEIVFAQYRKYLHQLLDVYQQPHGFVFVRLHPFALCQNFKPLIVGTKYVGVATSFSAVSVGDARKSVKREEVSIKTTPNPPSIRPPQFSFKSLWNINSICRLYKIYLIVWIFFFSNFWSSRTHPLSHR